MRTNKEIFILGFAICLIVGVTFSNSYKNNFVWDDHYFLLNWPQIKSPINNIGSLLKGEMPLGEGSVYRPVRSLFYALSYSIGHESPQFYHVQSILIHTFTTLLVFFIILKITHSKIIGSTASLLFGLHPLQVQSVTWITGSFVEGMNFFFLTSFLFYLMSKESATKWFKPVSYVCAYLAYGGNELTFTLPLILWLYEIVVRNQSLKEWQNILISHRYYWWGIIFFVCLRFLVMPERSQLLPLFQGLPAIMLANCILIFWYFRLLIWPNVLATNQPLGFGLTAFSRDDFQGIFPTEKLLNPYSFMGAVLIIGLIIVVLYLRKKHLSTAAFFLALSLVSFLPVLQWVPTQNLFFHHYAYFSLFFFSGFVADIFWRFIASIAPTSKMRYSVSLIIIISAALAVKTWQQNKVWFSEKTLWEDAYRFSPDSAKVNYNLGLAYYRNGAIDAAISKLTQAVSLNPHNPTHTNGLLNALLESGRENAFMQTALLLTQDPWNNDFMCGLTKSVLSNQHRLDLYPNLVTCK